MLEYVLERCGNTKSRWCCQKVEYQLGKAGEHAEVISIGRKQKGTHVMRFLVDLFLCAFSTFSLTVDGRSLMTVLVRLANYPCTFRTDGWQSCCEKLKRKFGCEKTILIRPNTTGSPLNELVNAVQVFAFCIATEKGQMVV